MDKQMVRHLTATVAYRFAKQVKGAADEFGLFDAGSSVVAPVGIVNHMTLVIRYGQMLIDEEIQPTQPNTSGLCEAAREFHQALNQLDDMLIKGEKMIKYCARLCRGHWQMC
jgi:hypothetical protein